MKQDSQERAMETPLEKAAEILAELPPQRVEYVLGYAQGVIACQRQREEEAEEKKPA